MTGAWAEIAKLARNDVAGAVEVAKKFPRDSVVMRALIKLQDDPAAFLAAVKKAGGEAK